MVFLPKFIVNEPITKAVNSSQIKQKNHVKIIKKIKEIITYKSSIMVRHEGAKGVRLGQVDGRAVLPGCQQHLFYFLSSVVLIQTLTYSLNCSYIFMCFSVCVLYYTGFCFLKRKMENYLHVV